MGECKKLIPPTFEEASKHIVDPDYGLGLTWLWQLPATHPFHRAAAIHDLRYDYLRPGESTDFIDAELSTGFREVCNGELFNGWLCLQEILFTKLAIVRGEIFEQGPLMCEYKGCHSFKPCTYGQSTVYDYRCTTCGQHKELESND